MIEREGEERERKKENDGHLGQWERGKNGGEGKKKGERENEGEGDRKKRIKG